MGPAAVCLVRAQQDADGFGSHPLTGFQGLRSPAVDACSLGDQATAQAEAEGRDQQDADIGCHQTHRVGDVAQLQPGAWGKRSGVSPPPLPVPSPTTPGYPYLVTPMCRANTSHELPAGKQEGIESADPQGQDVRPP